MGMKIYGSFAADSYQKSGTQSFTLKTVTLKYDNHGGEAKNNVARRFCGPRCAIGLLETSSINWT